MDYFNLTGFTINNFRVFGEVTHFDIAPLTILTGTNSSGKSSFTKALHLLVESYKANGLRKLELMESELKIGSFKAIKNSFKKNSEISFALEISAVDIFDHSYSPKKFRIELDYIESGLKGFKVTTNSELVLERLWELKGNVSVVKSFIKLPDKVINHDVVRNLFKGLSEKKVQIIVASILQYLQNNIQAHTLNTDDYELDFQIKNYDKIEETHIRIIAGLTNLGKVKNLDQSYFDQESKEEFFYKETFVVSANPTLEDILPSSILDVSDASILNTPLKELLNVEVVNKLELFPLKILRDLFGRFEFLDGVRATQEIIYTKANSPGFYKILSEVHSKGNNTFTELRRWIVDKFQLIQLEEGQKIEDVIRLNQVPGYGYILQIKKNGKEIGLNGLGYGVAQLLPILIKVLLHPNAIFIIEEPESNLHPALQSKLADFFTHAINHLQYFLPPRFIIETHSEYLIRKLQYLTAKGEFKPEQSQIYYFNHLDNKDENEKQVKNININKDGSLTDNFGKGFFDEADNIALELFLLNQSQKN